MRPRDAIIPGGELLYRSLEYDWVDGDCVLPEAIDGQGTSCARGSQCTPTEAIVIVAGTNHPERNGLASILTADLPQDMVLQNGINYDVFAYDKPETGFEPHCEIRWRRVSDRPSEEHFVGLASSAKRELKWAIAKRMNIIVPPTPGPEEP